MDRLSITKRIQMIKTYYKNCDSATAIYRDLRGDYVLHNRPTTQAIGKIVKKFEDWSCYKYCTHIVYVTNIVYGCNKQETFPGRVIYYRGDINWPPITNKSLTFEHLKTNISQVMAEIPPNMCQKATLRVVVI